MMKKAACILTMAVTMLGLLIPQLTFAADSYTDVVVTSEQGKNYGRGNSDSNYPAELAWGEAYWMEEYVQLYKTTGDRVWLDKLVDHGDRVISKAIDYEGDGDSYLGFPDPKYAHNQLKNRDLSLLSPKSGAAELVLNGSFEGSPTTGGGLPPSWSRAGNLSTTVPSTFKSVSPGAAYAGSAAAVVESDGVNNNGLTQTIGVVDGKRYAVEVFAKVETEKTEGLIKVTSGANTTEIRVHHAGYERYVLNFTASGTAATIQLGLVTQARTVTGLKAYYDEVSIRQTDDMPAEKAANGSFNTPNGSDPTLPASWTRASGTSSTEAYLSNAENEFKGSAGYGVAVLNGGSSANYVTQTLSYTPSQAYVVTFDGRANSSSREAKLEIYNSTTGSVIQSGTVSGTSWLTRRFDFTAPATGTVVIRLTTGDPLAAGAKAYFDNVAVQPVTAYNVPLGFSANTGTSGAYMTNSAATGSAVGWGAVLSRSSGSPEPVLHQELLQYDAGRRYRAALWSYVSASGSGVLRAYDVTTSSVIASKPLTNTSRARTDLDFVAPAAGHQVRIEVAVTSTTGKLTISSLESQPFYEKFLEDSRIANPLLSFANLIFDDPALDADSLYNAKAKQYLTFVAKHIYSKHAGDWQQITGTDGADNGTGVFRNKTGNAQDWFPGRSLPNNQLSVITQLLYQLHDATANAANWPANDAALNYTFNQSTRDQYLSRANDIMRAMKAVSIKEHHLNSASLNAFETRYWDEFGDWDKGHYYVNKPDDLHYASITASGPLEAHKRGHVFTREDMEQFADTFTDYLWNGSLTDPILRSHSYEETVANDNGPFDMNDRNNTYELLYWIDFAQFDPQIWEIVNAIQDQKGSHISYSSAPLSLWSRNKAVNASFETTSSTDAALPMYWSRSTSTAATAFLDSTTAYTGKKSLQVKTNGTGWQIVKQPLTDYVPNTAYNVSFYGKTNGNVSGRVQAFNATTGVAINSASFSSTSWEAGAFTFTTPANGTDTVEIRLFHTSYTPTNGIAYFDDVRALPNLSNSAVPNSGFELGQSGVPDYWQLAAGTNGANVSLDNTQKSQGSASLKITKPLADPVQTVAYDWQGFLPNRSYKLTATGKTHVATATGTVKVINATTGVTLATINVSGTDWVTQTVTFTTPAAYTDTLQILATTTGGTMWVDDVGVTLN